MSDDGLFSVITPVWNGARWLERAIGSVLDQTDRRFELIVVDDGSEDDSAAIAERIAAEDDRVRVIRLPNASGGPAHPRNVGLRAARGEFVAFLDQDDWWLPTKLEQQRAKFAEDDYALVYSDALLWRGEPGVFEEAWWGYLPSVRPHKVQPEGDVLVDLATGNFIPALSVAVRTSWVRQVGSSTRPPSVSTTGSTGSRCPSWVGASASSVSPSRCTTTRSGHASAATTRPTSAASGRSSRSCPPGSRRPQVCSRSGSPASERCWCSTTSTR
jgi:hypothetical protein